MTSRYRIIAAVAALSLGVSAWAQQTKVTGKVVDEDDNPVAGAYVAVREGTVGEAAMTDSDGEFVIDVRDRANAIIDVSMIGFLPAETRITTDALFIRLKEQPLSIEDAVVVAYGSVNKKDMTGSVAKVNVETLAEAPVTTFAEALAGKVAGVVVSANDGQPGSEMNIIIRGANSITQDNSPLYIVDGFPVEDFTTASLNPEDIKTFNILKDASATALYGARGANGVIVIETKGGIKGKPQISFSTKLGVSAVTNKMEMMSPYEFVKYQLELYPSTAVDSYLSDGRTLEWYKTAKGIDWQDEIFREVFTQNYSLAIRGGTDNTKYSVSGQVSYQPGVIMNTGSDKYQVNSTLEQRLGKKVALTVNIYGSHITNYGQIVASGDGGTTSSYLLYRTWAFRPITGDEDFDLLTSLSDPDNLSNADIRLNPLITSQNDGTRNANFSVNGNVGLRYSIMRGLQLKLSGSLRYNQEKRSIYNNSKTTAGSPVNPTNTMGVNGSIRYSDSFTYSGEAVLSYDKLLKGTHRFGAMAGASIQDRKFEQYGYTGYELDEYESLGMAGLDNGLMKSALANALEFSLASFFGRFNYGYKSKYLLTLTVRADGSSKFPNHRWGIFTSGAFAWNIKDENFLKDVSWLSEMKLRLSYGVTGNNRVGDYDAYAALSVPIDASYSFGGSEPVRGLVPTAMGNADLRWETTYQADLGLDLSFFDERIAIVVDLYDKRTKNLLLLTDAPRTTGYASIMKNAGEVHNKGLEISLNTVNIRNRNFEWTTSFNIAFNRNKIAKLYDQTKQMFKTVGFFTAYKASPTYIAEVGRPMGLFYGYVFDGVYQYSDFDCTAPGVYVLKPDVPSNSSAADRGSIQPGDIKYKDLNGDGQVNDDDMTIIGNGNPIHTGGLTNSFRFKDFDLSFLFSWSYGNDLYNANRLLFEGNAIQGKDMNQYATYNQRWTPSNPSNEYYRAGGGGPEGRHSSRVVEDGSYLRLKTLTLGYTIPKRLTQKIGIDNLRFSLSGWNLLTFTDYSGMDPEVSTRGKDPLTPGFDYSAYPIAKSFVLGIQLTF